LSATVEEYSTGAVGTWYLVLRVQFPCTTTLTTLSISTVALLVPVQFLCHALLQVPHILVPCMTYLYEYPALFRTVVVTLTGSIPVQHALLRVE
jgi:hypothetical protein